MNHTPIKIVALLIVLVLLIMHQAYAEYEPDYFGGKDYQSNINDNSEEVSDWQCFKVLLIIVVTWFLILNRKLFKFWFYLIFIACLMEGFGLGCILNRGDLEMAALLIIGFFVIIFGRIFGGGKS